MVGTTQAPDWDAFLRTQAEIVNCSECRRRSSSDPNSPQPSYVGKNYQQGGLVIVLQNPGSPPKDWQNEERERRLSQVLASFRTEPSTERYRMIVSEIRGQMTGQPPTQPAWRSWLHPVQKCVAGVSTLDELGWLNVVKHRTHGSSETNRATLRIEEEHGLMAHLRHELDVLAPGVILAVGAAAGRALERLSGSWRLVSIGQRASASDVFKASALIRTALST